MPELNPSDVERRNLRTLDARHCLATESYPFVPGATMIQKRLFPGIVTLGLLLCLGVTSASLAAQERPAQLAQQQAAAAPSTPHRDIRPIEEQQRVTAYTLPPDLYQKAQTLGRIRFVNNLVNFVYGLFVFWLILHWRLAPKFRDWAESVSSNTLRTGCRLYSALDRDGRGPRIAHSDLRTHYFPAIWVVRGGLGRSGVGLGQGHVPFPGDRQHFGLDSLRRHSPQPA